MQRQFMLNFEKIAHSFEAFWRFHELAWPTSRSSLMSSRPFLKRIYHSWNLPRDTQSSSETCCKNRNDSVNPLHSLKQNLISALCSTLFFVLTTQTYCHFMGITSLPVNQITWNFYWQSGKDIPFEVLQLHQDGSIKNASIEEVLFTLT